MERRRSSTPCRSTPRSRVACGRIYAAVASAGRKATGARSLDLLIAATALAAGLPPSARNPADFRGIEGLVEVLTVDPAS